MWRHSPVPPRKQALLKWRNVSSSSNLSPFLALFSRVGRSGQMIKPVLDWPEPDFRRQLQRVLGFANFFRCYIQNYSQISAPRHSLTSMKSTFFWNKEAPHLSWTETEFLTSTHRHSTWPFEHFALEIDASETNWRANTNSSPHLHVWIPTLGDRKSNYGGFTEWTWPWRRAPRPNEHLSTVHPEVIHWFRSAKFRVLRWFGSGPVLVSPSLPQVATD